MSEKKQPSTKEKAAIIKESNRSLPTTNTTTPMPQVKPPKSDNRGSKKN